MGAIKGEKFLGIAPKLASENLPENAAQVAKNCKLYSGDLIPYKESVLEATLTKAGVIKSIYPMDYDTGGGVMGKKWLHWTDDVDVVRTMTDGATDQRVYYTGDTTAVSGPKATDYTLATGGAGSYPQAWWILGLPKPTGTPTAVAVFPNSMTSITHVGSLATATTAANHGLITGDIVFISGAAQSEYNISTAVIVTGVTTFTYVIAGNPAAASGTIVWAKGNTIAKARYYVYTWYTGWGWESKPSAAATMVIAMDGQDVTVGALPTAAPANYANITLLHIYRTVTGSSGTAYYQVYEKTIDATTTYTDNVDEAALISPLTSQNYDAPPATMKGLTSMPNGILAGFDGNYVYFSEPYKPWAWPVSYRKAMDFTVVGLACTGTTLVVCTDSKPAYITGNTSSAMSVSRPDLHYPCVSKRSIVNMGWGILFASFDGLVQVSAGLGNKLATKLVNYRDEWLSLSPASIVASQHADKYIATHPTGGLTFERDDQTGGNLTTLDTRFTGAYHHASESALYYIDYLSVSPNSTVYKFDNQAGANLSMDWMSKTIVIPRALNLGSAMVQADYTGYSQPAVDAALATYNADATSANADGELNATEANVYDLNGDSGQTLPVIDGVVLFQWYVDKALIYQTYVTDSKPFTLPTGYRATTYEYRMQSKIRIRYTEIGETALDLETV